ALKPLSKPQVIFVADEPHAYAQTLNRIRAENGEIDAVWYLRAGEDRNRIRDQGAIVKLIQALATAGLRKARISLCGEYGSALERCHVESWLGYARSIARILPEMKLAVIQSPATGPRDQMTLWARRLWDEMRAPDGPSAFYEGSKRYVLRLRAVENT